LLYILATLLAVLPDIDVFIIIAFPDLPLTHRGITHSIIFSFIVAAIFTLSFVSKIDIGVRKLFAILFLSGVSHALLDYLMGQGPMALS